MEFDFKEDHLKAIMPRMKDVSAWYHIMLELFPLYEIDTKERVAGFIAQCAVESLEFSVMVENLNYSADGLNTTFAKYFRLAGRDANAYARKPEMIANVVYANRLGNGDEKSGDGWKFRGHGIIQLTGKENTSNFAKYIHKSLDDTLEYIQTKEGALESACWYWKIRNINSAADERDIVKMSRLVNGGTNGLSDRKEYYIRAVRTLGTTTPIVEPTLDTILKLGSKGPAVKELQEKLGIEADGSFGPGTSTAVKNFQKKHGLNPDGIVGPSTYSKIRGK